MELRFSELNSNECYQYCLLLNQLSTINIEKINESDFIKHLHMIKSNPLHKIIVVKYQDKIIGSITVLIEPKIVHNLSFVAHIEDVVVDKEYRNKGIGKQLIQKAIDIAKIYNCYKIVLYCQENREEFYRKCGFIRKGIYMMHKL